jgi:hypothetical protein
MDIAGSNQGKSSFTFPSRELPSIPMGLAESLDTQLQSIHQTFSSRPGSELLSAHCQTPHSITIAGISIGVGPRLD